VDESAVDRERELRSRLSRQAAAHDDHVKEVLRVQQHELQTAFDVRLAGRVDRERATLQQKVAGWTGRMNGIDKALAGSSLLCFSLRVTHTRLTTLCPGLPGCAGTRKIKPICILLKQVKVSVSGISWAVCKSALCSIQITTPAPHHSVFTGRMPFLLPNQQHQSTEGKPVCM